LYDIGSRRLAPMCGAVYHRDKVKKAAVVAFAGVIALCSQSLAASPQDLFIPVTPAPATVSAGVSPTAHPPFRLGDAARPFGWATVVGDLNRDGQPDVAVADHLASRPDGYAYRLEFSVSGQRPQHVTFESGHDAVTVSLADVDHDNDFDIVVGVPFSGETIGVWLNDGHGRFTRGEVPPVPQTIRATHAFTANPMATASACVIPARRLHGPIAYSTHERVIKVPVADASPRGDPLRYSCPASFSLAPRAPPPAFRL
jgi:hypothetical protein